MIYRYGLYNLVQAINEKEVPQCLVDSWAGPWPLVVAQKEMEWKRESLRMGRFHTLCFIGLCLPLFCVLVFLSPWIMTNIGVVCVFGGEIVVLITCFVYGYRKQDQLEERIRPSSEERYDAEKFCYVYQDFAETMGDMARLMGEEREAFLRSWADLSWEECCARSEEICCKLAENLSEKSRITPARTVWQGEPEEIRNIRSLLQRVLEVFRRFRLTNKKCEDFFAAKAETSVV